MIDELWAARKVRCHKVRLCKRGACLRGSADLGGRSGWGWHG